MDKRFEALQAKLRVAAQLRKEGTLPPLPPEYAEGARRAEAKDRKWQARKGQLRKEGKLQQLATEEKEEFRFVVSPPKFPNEEPTPEFDQFELTPIVPKRKRKRKKEPVEELDALAGFGMTSEEKIGKALGLVLALIIAFICLFAVCNKMNSDIARDKQTQERIQDLTEAQQKQFRGKP
jgi:hypothetical protein